jgi:hypothetical protein
MTFFDLALTEYNGNFFKVIFILGYEVRLALNIKWFEPFFLIILIFTFVNLNKICCQVHLSEG